MKKEKELNKVIKYVENKTGFLIFLKEGCGKLVTGTLDMEGERVNIAYVYSNNNTQALHEFGHMLGTPGARPFSKISLLLRELTAWTYSEFLHDEFNIPFDENVFDEGLGSYIVDLIVSDECPSLEWLSQLIGEGENHEKVG